MNYFRFGQGAQTLVILPGLSVQSVMGFADAAAESYRILADDYTVFVLDRRNELPDAYSVPEMARDTAAALRALGLSRVDLFGASQGGMIAMTLAIAHPELVRKLVLGSTAARMEDARFRTVEEWIRLARAGRSEELYLAFGEAVYPRSVFDASRELLSRAAKTVTDEELRRFVVLAEGMRHFDVVADLEKIACPVLVLGSADDRVLGTGASVQLAERLSRRGAAVLHLYDGYGHAAYDTAPDYKERILRFLAAEA